MKKSQFIVAQEGRNPDTILLYSTFTTSMVEINRRMYKAIFEDYDYGRYKNEALSLHEMGLLIDDDFDELNFLESLRIKTLMANETAPTYYIICPTTGCNARCYYCFEKDAVQRRMDERTAEAVAKYIVANHDDEHLVIQWFGGEPLLEPSTISYITAYLRDRGIRFDSKIITNGYLLSDEIVKEAVGKWNVRIIQITIDALGDEYNKIKNYVYTNTDPFEVVLKNIQRCLDAEINVRIRINFNPNEYKKAVDTVDFLKEKFGSHPNFFLYLAPIDDDNIPSITQEFRESRKHPLIELLDAEENFCSFGNYDLSQTSGSRYDAILRKYYLTPIPTACYGGCQSSLTIDSLGNIFDCHRLLGHQQFCSGNVFTGRVKNDISKKYANPYISDDECNQCNLLPLCHGGCKFRADKYGKEHACTSIKGAVKELIKRASREIYE